MYQIYMNVETKHLIPVKTQFQWLAFLTPNFWAWNRGLISLGWIHLLITVFLRWMVIPLIIQMVYQGVKAGEMHGKYLKENGYNEEGVVWAMDEFDAIKKYVNEDVPG